MEEWKHIASALREQVSNRWTTDKKRVKGYENQDKHCKIEHRALASRGLKLPLTAVERQRINPDSNQALSLYTMKIWPGIPLSPAIEMRGLHLRLLFLGTEGMAPPALYIY